MKDFEARGVMPPKTSFYYCHLSPSLMKAVSFFTKFEGRTAEDIENNFQTTIAEVREFDREVAKNLLRYIQNSGNAFDPDYGFSTILYDAFNKLGVFAMLNVEINLPNDATTTASVFRNEDMLTVYFKDKGVNCTFIQQIMFGNSKNFIKFALWKEQRTESILELYVFLAFVVAASRLTENAAKYPDINKEIGTIYLQQLKALENAV